MSASRQSDLKQARERGGGGGRRWGSQKTRSNGKNSP